MLWFEQLAALYGNEDVPLYHTEIFTDIVVYLSGGQFVHAYSERIRTVIPVTEESVCRTSAVTPHPLSDKLLYLSGEYSLPHHIAYIEGLREWAESDFSTERLMCVLRYLESGTLCSDLGQLPHDKRTAVRFVVDGVPLWQDDELISAHIAHIEAGSGEVGLCSVTGEIVPLGRTHQKRIVSPSDSGKLISFERRSRLIHQGRFSSPREISPIGSEVSFKAHAVLRRIIAQRGFTAGNRTFAAWDSLGALPLPFDKDEPDPHGCVTVIGLTLASQGRLSVSFYRYLSAQQYMDCCKAWRGLTLPTDAYGQSTERLLGCILDGRDLPQKHKTGELYEQAGL